eukprot:1161508-Amphidinium_carterae.2
MPRMPSVDLTKHSQCYGSSTLVTLHVKNISLFQYWSDSSSSAKANRSSANSLFLQCYKLLSNRSTCVL